MFSLLKKSKSRFPEGIVIQQIEPQDYAVIEEWKRECESHLIGIFGVYASKIKNSNDFPWQVEFGAGEYIREEPFVSKMNDAIVKAIMSLEGVKEAHHEDTEKYIVSGELSGSELVKVVSVAIDDFARTYLEEWEEHCNKT